jgi:hypothetical protein
MNDWLAYTVAVSVGLLTTMLLNNYLPLGW